MIGIISAMSVEMELLKNAMDIKQEKLISSSTYYVGTLYGKDIVLVQCGVGKTNAAICTQTLILTFAPTLIINTGVAGGMGEKVKIGDLVIVSSCVQHDYDTTALDKVPLGTVFTNKGNIRFFNCDEKHNKIFLETGKELYAGAVHTGIVATGDQFVADPKKCDFLQTEFGATVCEMELGSIAQTCYLNDTALVSLKSISDNANDDGKVDFFAFAKSSAHRNCEFLKTVFKNILL